jgi:RimJ/RimL family protein N-acetyltransferase
MENFNFYEENILEDDRVQLRPIQVHDADHLLPFVLDEPEIWKYSSKSPAGSRENLERYIASALDARINKTEYPFIVFDKKAQRYAGSTRFYDMQFQQSTLQLGYTWYGREFQGTGLNKH